MARLLLSLPLILASLAAYRQFKRAERPRAAVTATVLLGLAVAMLYDPGFLHAATALPRDALLLMPCSICAFFLIGALDTALGPTIPSRTPRRERAARHIERGLAVTCALLPTIPLVIRACTTSGPALVWPAAAALIASLVLLLSGFLVWGWVIRRLVTGGRPTMAWAMALPPMLGETALIGTPGIWLWLEVAGGSGRWDPHLFNRALTAMLVGMGIGAGAMAIVAITRHRGTSGAKPALLLTVGLAVCWAMVLCQVRPAEPPALPALIVLGLLAPLFWASFLVPYMVVDQGEWAPIVFLIALPIAVLVGLLILWGWPPLVAWLLEQHMALGAG